MKAYLYSILICLLIPNAGLAQKNFMQDGKLNGVLPVNQSGKVTYQLIKTVDSTTKDELFKRVRKWFTNTYTSSKDVLQVSDASTGELTGRGIFNVTESYMGFSHTYPISHLLSVELKDGRYRVTITDFVVDDLKAKFPVENFPNANRKFLDKFYTKIDAEVAALLASLQKAAITSNDF